VRELLPFLRAKAIDTLAVLDWVEREFAALRQLTPERAALLNHLEGKAAETRTHAGALQQIIALGDTPLLARGIPVVHSLEAATSILALTYLPALRQQGNDERFLGGLLRVAARSGGITWLRDIIARLDGPHGAFVAYPEFPIIYAPPRHAASVFDMPGLYHELGHVAFHHERDIGPALGAVVIAHFDELRRQGGLLTPAKRAERDSELALAAMYWSEPRLEEIFCDVYATFVLGAAHYASLVDLALRTNHNPFGVLPDAHPPLAARVRACHETLTPSQRGMPLVVTLRDAWAAHEHAHGANHQYELTCGDALLDALRNEALRCIASYLPDAVRYDRTLAVGGLEGRIEPGASLEHILNIAAQLLFLAPERYGAWEPEAMARCREIAL
jgi:hypothetical protein